MNAKLLLDWIRREQIGLGLIIAAWAVFFGHIFLAGNVFFLDDLKIIYYPLEHAYAQAQANWDLPLWSNEFGFGQPLLAWGQLGFFTPLHVLLRALGTHPLVLLQISIAVYFLAGLVGWYIFFRKRTFEQMPAVLGAGIFVLGGFSIAHLNHVNFYTGTMLLPYLLLAGAALVQQSSVRRVGILALVAASIALSAQPQVVLFTFIAAAGILGLFAFERPYRKHWHRLALGVLAAGLLGAGMASLSILPLFEFLPETERATPLPRPELLEFSYPPWHAVTLVLPYFYGNHDAYWGAKGFQELAAFTGLIPLFLAGGALVHWKRHRSERIAGVLFVLLAILFALGRYSPLYAYLVENQFITSLGVASRFVFFFDIGLALLAACGLSDLAQRSRKRIPFPFATTGILVPGVIFVPFLIRILQSSPERLQLRILFESTDAFLLLALATVAAICAAIFMRWKHRIHALAILSVITLIAYAWNYNPPTPAKTAFSTSTLSTQLLAYNALDGTPPRLYSRPALIQSHTSESENVRYSDPISPHFSVFQPLPVTKPFNCVAIRLEAPESATADIVVGLHEDPLMDPTAEATIPGYDVGRSAEQQVCFASTSMAIGKTVWISLTSVQPSGVLVAFAPQMNPNFQARFVRVPHPNDTQWKQSQKPLQVLIAPDVTSIFDEEAAARARHMQVLEGASSARWIGALSIREYRAFIEFFFANDGAPFDGDGIHVIEKYRSLVDMVGVTHLAQLLPAGATDEMESHGFALTATQDLGAQELRVYENPQAYPKAFLVPSAIWKPAADETRDAMSQPEFDPRAVVYLSGPKPPEDIIGPGREMAASETSIATYKPTRVDVLVTTPQDAYLVLTDATTPQWQTYIDGKPALQLVGNSIFKAAQVPVGKHTVSFRYESPTTKRAVRIASISFGVSLIALAYRPRTWNLRQ